MDIVTITEQEFTEVQVLLVLPDGTEIGISDWDLIPGTEEELTIEDTRYYIPPGASRWTCGPGGENPVNRLHLLLAGAG